MSNLVTKRNLTDQDAAYAALIGAHAGLSKSESIAFNARLVLILINHIGDAGILSEALALAKAARPVSAQARPPSRLLRSSNSALKLDADQRSDLAPE